MQQLQTVDADTLLYEPLEKPSFVVDGLIPTGLSLFCGSAFACRRESPYGICRHWRATCFTCVWKIRSAAYRTGCSV